MITQDAPKEKKKKGDEKDNIPPSILDSRRNMREDRERSEETSRHDSKTAGFHNVSVSKLMFSVMTILN